MQDRFNAFTVLVDKLKRNIRKIKTEEMAEFNLKSPHVSCLYYLYKFKPMTSKELSDLCEEDKAAVSRSIEYLEGNGYVLCASKKQKRYKTLLELTEKGVQTAKLIATKIDGMLERASEGLPEADRLIMYRSLELISNNLQRICDGYEE